MELIKSLLKENDFSNYSQMESESMVHNMFNTLYHNFNSQLHKLMAEQNLEKSLRGEINDYSKRVRNVIHGYVNSSIDKHINRSETTPNDSNLMKDYIKRFITGDIGKLVDEVKPYVHDYFANRLEKIPRQAHASLIVLSMLDKVIHETFGKYAINIFLTK